MRITTCTPEVSMIRPALLIAVVFYATAARAEPAPTPAPALSNPAAALCVKDGARVEIEKAPNGSDQGFCVFPSGSRISEWAYFRNKHRTLR